MNPVTNTRIATSIIAVCIALLFIANVAAVAYAVDSGHDLRQGQVGACERGNVVRAVINDIIDHTYPEYPQAARLAILHCDEVVR